MKTFATALMMLTLSTAFSACRTEDDSKAPAPTADAGAANSAAKAAHGSTNTTNTTTTTTTEADAGATATATSADASASPTGAALFLGKWRYVSGTVTIACDGQPDQLVPQTGTMVFTDGDGPDEVVVSDGEGCDIPCKVSGNVATAYRGYVCPGDVAEESLVYTVQDGTLREQVAGNLPVDAQLCDFTGDSMLARD